MKLITSFFALNILILSLFSNIVCGQNGDFKFERVTTNDGLSHSNVLSIAKDYQGFVWFGTEDGITKYDGVSCTIYRNDKNNPSSINDNMGRSIIEDSYRNIWIGTSNGLNLYKREYNNFQVYWQYNDGEGEAQGIINTLFEDSNHHLWIGHKYGVEKFNFADSTFEKYPLPGVDSTKVVEVEVREIKEDKHGYIWIGSSIGVFVFDPVKKEFKNEYRDLFYKYGLEDVIVYSFFEDNQGHFWIGTLNNGALLFNPENFSIKKYDHKATDPNSISNNHVAHIIQDETGNIWFGTSRGLSYIKSTDLQDNKIRFGKMYSNPGDNKSLLSDIIECLYLSDENRLWIGSRFGGVNFHDKKSKHFMSFKHDRNDLNSISNNNITSMAEDSKGNIWIATDGGGLNKLNPLNKKFTHYMHNPVDKNSPSNDKILAIQIDKKDNLWFGMWGGGINYLDRKNNKYFHFKNDPDNDNTIGSDNVFTLYQDDNDILWIGTWGAGFNSYNPKTKKFTRYYPRYKNVSTEYTGKIIRHIIEDSNHELWLASETNGVTIFNKESETFRNFQHNEDDTSSLSNNFVESVFEDSMKRIWVATRSGLDLYNPEHQNFRHFTMEDGLPSNVIIGINEDQNGTLWLSTNYGISKVSVIEKDKRIFLECKNYNANDGLINNQ
jgi:ligand-binding sensor domain-containing protein